MQRIDSMIDFMMALRFRVADGFGNGRRETGN
jgi:hypothetical protein